MESLFFEFEFHQKPTNICIFQRYVEVTPDCCPETRDNQQHITGIILLAQNLRRNTWAFDILGDISFAARQYWAATYDTEWLYGENYAFPLEVNKILPQRGALV